MHWYEVENAGPGTVIVDVRTEEEFEAGHIQDAVNIPVDELRDRLPEIPRNKTICVYCAVGLRGYTASRILLQHGYEAVYNLSGGYKTYACVLQDKYGTGDECDLFPAIGDDGEIKTNPVPSREHA